MADTWDEGGPDRLYLGIDGTMGDAHDPGIDCDACAYPEGREPLPGPVYKSFDCLEDGSVVLAETQGGAE